MEFIRQHKFFFISTLLFFVLALFLYYNWLEIEGKKKVIQNKINTIEKDLNKLVLFDYKLTEANISISENNLVNYKTFYNDFKMRLIEKYKISLPPVHLLEKHPVDIKRNLTVWVKRNLEKLSQNGIKLDGALTFEKYITKESSPPLIEEIELIYKHLFIVEFLLKVLNEGNIKEIVKFDRRDDLVFKQSVHWQSSRYQLTVLTSISGLKKIINTLSNNTKLFIVIKEQEVSSTITIAKREEGKEKKDIIKKVKIGKLTHPFKLKETELKLIFDVYEFGDYK